jgi:oligoendopeptidase F
MISSFYQKINERVTQINHYFIFFTILLSDIDEELLNQSYKKNKKLEFFKPFIDHSRAFTKHKLSFDLEKFSLDKSLTSNQAWVRLYDEELSKVRCSLHGKTLTLEETLNSMSDLDFKTRHDGASSLSEGLGSHLPLLTFITNTLIKDKEIEDRWRHYDTPQMQRHIENQIEEDVVETLVTVVKENYKDISHRYYRIKAKLLDLPYLNYWDRNAPSMTLETFNHFSFERAKGIVLDAFASFNQQCAEIAAQFFEKKWIDAKMDDHKQSGAFSHPTVPSVHPYIMMNFQGKLRDIYTLAHEVGHGVHQVLCQPLGYLLSDTPLTLAETASVFAEMLTFQYLYQKAQTREEKIYLLSSKIEDMINTVIRQVAFYEFEKKIHNARKLKELSVDDLSFFWIETQREALGESVYCDPIISSFWSYISHFVHVPFYVYSYAFGDCLVNSLYGVYEKSKSEGGEFEQKYLNLLQSGGTKSYSVLLNDFGFDPKIKSFWQTGLNLIKRFIDELETL